MPTKTRAKAGVKALQRGVGHTAAKVRATKKERDTQDLRGVLGTKLQEIHDVEVQIVKTLPKLMKKAKDPDLQEAMAHHLKQTEGHVARAEEACGILGIKPQKGRSAAIRGLADDTETALAHHGGDELTDAVLSAALRAVEHYEIAAYGAMREWAELIGERQISELLEETLHEEEEAADALTDLALSKLNAKAAGDPEGTVSSIFMGSAVVRNGDQEEKEKKVTDDGKDDGPAGGEEDDDDEEGDDEEGDDEDEDDDEKDEDEG